MSVHPPNNLQYSAMNNNPITMIGMEGGNSGSSLDAYPQQDGMHSTSEAAAPIRITRRMNVKIQGSLSDFAQVFLLRIFQT
jgi:hypothetical protein